MKDNYMKFNEVLNEQNYELKRQQSRMNKFSSDKVLKMLKKLDQGRILIEFMTRNNKTDLVVKFDTDIAWLLNKGHKNIVYFQSINSFTNHIKQSIDSIYKSDLKAVYREVFDPQEMDAIFRQIKSYSIQYKSKSKSLAFKKSDAVDGEKNTDWDMEIRFRRSLEKMSKGPDWKIHPILTANKEFGKIIAPNEQENEWGQEKIEKFIASLK
jgi:uncharacterized protein (DUF2344 family)